MTALLGVAEIAEKWLLDCTDRFACARRIGQHQRISCHVVVLIVK